MIRGQSVMIIAEEGKKYLMLILDDFSRYIRLFIYKCIIAESRKK